ncbi:TonB-dependent receptor domain-containing protein [[Mannheimia] succiniciproducens]|uniref:CirA protein n=1 Tax=Mannheimia succiniciproducens (strain KCTC 0769BP / MBEL55E) TaxID=221988 RepID=Q65V87_MANSM|nr:TonB-dependent receptor [[Mannheimia] succiniciproducens]AAU37123.1 CirA protein [[Mannheimia] succiniciproducens MBEL55E]
MKKLKISLLPLTAFVAATVHAETLDTIDVVSDNFSPQAENIAAKGVTKVRQATKMSDVIRGVPGVNVNGARSTVERYNIRGVSEEYLNVTVDGARQNGYSFHHNGNYGIDPEILKRVDIDVGSNSVSTGAGSLGGSMKFETVDAADMLEEGENFGGKVKYGYGSNGNSNQGTAMLYGRRGNLDLLGYFNYRHQRDGEDGNGLKNKNKGHLSNYLFKTKYNISNEQWIKASAERYTNTALSCYRANMGMCLGDVPQPGEPGYVETNHGKAYTELTRKTYTLSYGFNPEHNNWVNIKANAYNTETEVASMGSPKSKVRTVGGTLSNTSEFELGVTSHQFLVGGEYYNSKAQALGSVNNAYVADMDSTSVYVEDKIALGNLMIIPGVRFDHYKADLASDFDKSYHRFSKALGLKYSLTDNLIVFANYTELFKGPDAGEIYLRGTRAYDGNLEAARGDNKEVGFSYAKDGLFSDIDGFSFTAKYFKTDYDNINQTVSASRCVNTSAISSGSIYCNLGKVDIKGVEAQAKYRYEDTSFSVSYARARSEQKSTGLAAFADTGDRYNFTLSQYISSAQVELGWNTMYVRAIDVDDSTLKESYAVSNMYVSWSPAQAKGLELTFGIDNIFDKAYKDHSTQYYGSVDLDPGRNYKLSVSYKF